jgi:uncharacterized phage-associated protein
MPIDALAVANYFLDLADKAGQKLTPMKLQKLVYFAHGWHFGLTGGEPLLDEQVQAWSFGPLIFSIDEAFREYGTDELTLHGAAYNYDEGPPVWEVPSLDDYPEHVAERVRPLLKRIWEVYGGLTTGQLSNMVTGEGTPWAAVHAAYNGNIPKYTTIPEVALTRHFQEQAARQGSAA